ncbi:MAG: hypothetical protein IJ719_09135 [Clostridia bacterium]|nr:hypothetical protein [Clostridia bacterium]
MECMDIIEEHDDLEVENEALRDSLDTARTYYSASQREIAYLITVILDNGLTIPLDDHYLDINGLTSDTDPQKGDYDFPIEAMSYDSFCFDP